VTYGSSLREQTISVLQSTFQLVGLPNKELGNAELETVVARVFDAASLYAVLSRWLVP
jgi:hypothetical protein